MVCFGRGSLVRQTGHDRREPGACGYPLLGAPQAGRGTGGEFAQGGGGEGSVGDDHSGIRADADMDRDAGAGGGGLPAPSGLFHRGEHVHGGGIVGALSRARGLGDELVDHAGAARGARTYCARHLPGRSASDVPGAARERGQVEYRDEKIFRCTYPGISYAFLAK